jgi:hypothetical protein
MEGLLTNRQLGTLQRFLQFLDGDGPLIVLEQADHLPNLIRSTRLILLGEQPLFSRWKDRTEIIEAHPLDITFDDFVERYDQKCQEKEMLFLYLGGGKLSGELRFFIQQFKHELTSDRERRGAATFIATSAANVQTSDRDLPALFGPGRFIFLRG